MAAILIELAFITNEGDADLLQNNQSDFAKRLAGYFGLTLPAPDVVDKPKEPLKNTLNDEQVKIISSLSAKYESSGDPACVANNAGDLGGISYGKYQFASNVGRALKIHKINSDGFNPTVARTRHY